jgi:tRNA(Ser,Leu) C12 N-acetylase TAN1
MVPTPTMNEARLNARINQAYHYLKERGYDKFIDFLETEESLESRKEIIIKANKVFPFILDYKVIEIEITGEKAKVKMDVSFLMRGKEEKQIHFDYWILKGNEWFINEFGKMW